MRQIEIQTWARREHFNVYSTFDYPHFNMCANVDLSAFNSTLKQQGVSFTVALVYVITRAANAVPEFRQRIRPGMVVEHEIVHPSMTILVEGDVFSFCSMNYTEDFSAFEANAAEAIARVKENPTLEEDPGQDNLLFMTAIPWVSFTSFMHPIHLHPIDCVPRFAWGRYFEEGDRLKMPLSVQGHHALMDGLHMGRYYAHVQELLDQPGRFLGG